MPEREHLAIVILAAGKGTRMKSSLAKVLHPVYCKPMIQHVLNCCAPLPSNNRVVIVGHQKDRVIESVTATDCTFVEQQEQLGTAHAVLIAENAIKDSCDNVLILCGDTPLIRPETLVAMYDTHTTNNATLTFMTTHLENPANYGRILSDAQGTPIRIIEEKDATRAEKAINEINAGIYIVNKHFLYQALHQVDSNNSQGEFYLTDIVERAITENQRVEKYVTTDAQDVLGVNSRVELAEAEQELRLRHNKTIMLTGVSLLSPGTTYISEETDVGQDTLLGAGVELRGSCSIGADCFIDTGVILDNCTVATGTTIGAYSYLTDIKIKANMIIAPHSTSVPSTSI